MSTQRWGRFVDPAMERDFRLSVMAREVRGLRINLIALMVLRLLPMTLDFYYMPQGMVLGVYLPLRLALFPFLIFILLLPVRPSTYTLRHVCIMVALSYIWLLTATPPLWVDVMGVGVTVGFFISVVVLMNYLFLPTRWTWMLAWGVAASFIYVVLIMPQSGATPFQIQTAVVMHVLANIFGAFTAYQLATVRRAEFLRHRQLEEANEELRRREAIIADQRDQLAAQVVELGEAHRQLIETKDSLVQAEKMASLGGLVAGVAHELNTPMGIALTAGTHLRDSLQGLDQAVAEGRLTRSRLSEYQETLRDSTNLILSNVSRAAGLVQSFKQVAVDQASAERRLFPLGPYIDEVLHSLAPRLRKEPHELLVDCDPGLVMDSYPGALSQVLTNLLLNALVHAFPGGRVGLISIQARPLPGNQLELIFADNGKGVPPQHLDRLFDPFFTTNRAQGGSGLGLHIVYNLVTQTLGGSIRVCSTLGEGTCFTLILPRAVAGDATTPVEDVTG
ncbi:ATP-binding protein [Niveispirillum sp. BGYR6]|uniref:sensor histidine kinase n=1 Tax=Niveispirillum sp. BGYR6 TaxID=2971249 RepID=UPI0022B96624|nr:ATP-binding protein [Niveispirillum sp. BGYR6]